MPVLFTIYVAVWALCVIPIAYYARLNLRQDREYEGDERDPISPEGAVVIGLIWASFWPAAVAILIVYGIVRLIGLLLPEAD